MTVLHFVLWLAALAINANAVTLTVGKGGNASSSLLYGIMFEDINNSGIRIFNGNNGPQKSISDQIAQVMEGFTANCSGTMASRATTPA